MAFLTPGRYSLVLCENFDTYMSGQYVILLVVISF